MSNAFSPVLWIVALVALLVVVGGIVLVSLAFRPAVATRLLPVIRIGARLIAVAVGILWVVATLQVLFSDTVTVTIPVEPLPLDASPDGVVFTDGPTATIVSGGLDRMTAEVTGLTLGTRVTLALGILFMAGMTVVLAHVVARLAAAIRAGQPFRRDVPRAFLVAALAVFIGGGLGSLAGQLGGWLASREVLQVWGWNYSGPLSPDSLTDFGWPDAASLRLDFDSWPLFIGFALAAVGVAFHAGAVLAERAAVAERELEGLV
ncbi:hypothetical protein [Protaetiibacter intestinalis]|uniref:DUF2975 domain-containing protein n=1 Tax=Protaetiibacter intestinalis TaxID=2419774 RepID=A0A387B9P8_9MICO|nr:hypothetical protein [Protaetiibacter intestinalis]AYF97659.1 hypothetical protein D7I47_04885 [Protaetiibacter intestinalis]